MNYELHSITSFDGLTYSLTDWSGRFLLVATPGEWGLPPIEWQTRRLYKGDGVREVAYRLNQRPFFIQYRLNGECSRNDYWDARAALLNVMRPNRGGAMTYNFVRTDGTKRSLKVRSNSPTFVATDPQAWDEWSINEALQFEAFDPIWFETDIQGGDVTYAPVAELTFPITFDDDGIVFDEAYTFATHTITYAGTWFAYPIITLTPPFSSVTLYHFGLNKTIQFAKVLAAGEPAVIINLQDDVIENTDGDNLSGFMTPISDLQAFKIECDPLLAGGINRIGISVDGLSVPPTAVSIQYYNRYVGI